MKALIEKDKFDNGSLFDYFATARIQDVEVTDSKFNSYLAEIALDLSNLQFAFSNSSSDSSTKDRFYRRFLPPIKPFDIENFVSESISSNHNFYSFLGEYLMALVGRDILRLDLEKAILSFDDTIYSTHDGVDGCFFDRVQSRFIMGEAKFYEDYNNAIGEIKESFCSSNGFANKLDSFYKVIRNHHISGEIQDRKLLIRTFGKEEYDEISFNAFLSSGLGFYGFLTQCDKPGMDPEGLCDTSSITSASIRGNLHEVMNLPSFPLVYFYLIHLPIQNKEKLIVEVIEKAFALRGSLHDE